MQQTRLGAGCHLNSWADLLKIMWNPRDRIRNGEDRRLAEATSFPLCSAPTARTHFDTGLYPF